MYYTIQVCVQLLTTDLSQKCIENMGDTFFCSALSLSPALVGRPVHDDVIYLVQRRVLPEGAAQRERAAAAASVQKI
jgi:hypothetical protein